MRTVRIHKTLKEKVPQARLGCISCRVKTEKSPAGLLEKIRLLEEELQGDMEISQIQERAHILETRQCYKALGKDFRRYRSSSEAMHRRILKGKGLYEICNVVECNNYLSVKSGYSMGTYDLARIEGEIVWTVSEDGAHYEGIGKDFVNIERLPVLKDEKGFFGNPTSDSVRCRITEDSREILLCVFAFGGEKEQLLQVLREGEALLLEYCAGRDFETQIIE